MLGNTQPKLDTWLSTFALCLQLSLPPQNLSMLGKSDAVGLPQILDEPKLFPSKSKSVIEAGDTGDAGDADL